MAKISVIVPVYNSEKYLAHCLDSLCAQTFEDIEIICINDGSTDSCAKILEKYALFDNRIKVFEEENRGAAAARNLGIRKAESDYVCFVDSDDWVSQIMAKRLYENITKNGSDFAFCDVLWVDESARKSFSVLSAFPPDFAKEFEGKTFSAAKFNPYIYFDLNFAAANKIFRKDFLLTNRIFFPEGLIFEDIPFSAKAFLKAEKVSFEKEFLYYFRIERPDSVSALGDSRYFNIFKILKMLKDIFTMSPFDEDYKTAMLLFEMKMLLESFQKIHPDLQEQFFKAIKETYTNVRIENLDMNVLQNSPIFNDFIKFLQAEFTQVKHLNKHKLSV